MADTPQYADPLMAGYGEQQPIKPPSEEEKKSLRRPGDTTAATSGAAAYQAVTLGFGADIDEMLKKGQGQETRRLAASFKADHPFLGIAVDAAGAALVSKGAGAAVGATGLPAAMPRTYAALSSQVGSNALIGAAMGAGSGGTIGDRVESALFGGAVGGVGGAVIPKVTAGLGKMATRAAEAVGIADPAKLALGKIREGIESAGFKFKDVLNRMAANPQERLVDIVPDIESVARQAGAQGVKQLRRLEENVRNFANEQNQRFNDVTATAARPYASLKNKVADVIDTMSKDMDQAYKAAYKKNVPMSDELDKLLKTAPGQAALKEAQTNMATDISLGKISKQNYVPGKEVPLAFLDKTQRALQGQIASEKDPAMQASLIEMKNRVTDMMKKAAPEYAKGAEYSSVLGRSKDEAALMGTQWGNKFAKGVPEADMETFRSMTPWEKMHARFGLMDGIDDYLTMPGNKSTEFLQRTMQALESPEVKEILGTARGANYHAQVKSAVAKEYQRAINSNNLIKGMNRAEANDESITTAANYLGGKLMGEFGIVQRVMAKSSMGQAQAKEIIDAATKPGGLTALAASGKYNQEVIDRVKQLRALLTSATGPAAVSATGVNQSTLRSQGRASDQ